MSSTYTVKIPVPPALRPLVCFRCNTKLASVDPAHLPGYPYRGTIFSTHGHYGSTVIDEMLDGRRLEIVVCDECLRAAGHDGIVLDTRSRPAPSIVEDRIWDQSQPRSHP